MEVVAGGVVEEALLEGRLAARLVPEHAVLVPRPGQRSVPAIPAAPAAAEREQRVAAGELGGALRLLRSRDRPLPPGNLLRPPSLDLFKLREQRGCVVLCAK